MILNLTTVRFWVILVEDLGCDDGFPSEFSMLENLSCGALTQQKLIGRTSVAHHKIVTIATWT